MPSVALPARARIESKSVPVTGLPTAILDRLCTSPGQCPFWINRPWTTPMGELASWEQSWIVVMAASLSCL